MGKFGEGGLDVCGVGVNEGLEVPVGTGVVVAGAVEEGVGVTTVGVVVGVATESEDNT